MSAFLLSILILLGACEAASAAFVVKAMRNADFTHSPSRSMEIRNNCDVVFRAETQPRILPYTQDHTRTGRRTNYGTLSLVLGILSVVFIGALAGVYFGIPAIIFGNKGLKRRQRHSAAGKTLGIISAAITLVVGIGFLILVLAAHA